MHALFAAAAELEGQGELSRSANVTNQAISEGLQPVVKPVGSWLSNASSAIVDWSGSAASSVDEKLKLIDLDAAAKHHAGRAGLDFSVAAARGGGEVPAGVVEGFEAARARGRPLRHTGAENTLTDSVSERLSPLRFSFAVWEG